MSKCKLCGAEIIWTRMQSGKAMPVDAQPHYFRPDDDGHFTFITPEGETMKGEPEEMGIRGYISHFATCPNADQHRRKRK